MTWLPPPSGKPQALFTDDLWTAFCESDLGKGLDAWVEHEFTRKPKPSEREPDVDLGSLNWHEAKDLADMIKHVQQDGCPEHRAMISQWLTSIAMRVVAEVERIEEMDDD